MNKIQKHGWMLLTIILAVSLTVYVLSYIVTEPWHAMPGLGGDGIKNEYAYLYQSVYGKGFWFDGMNYPYGDNIVFADGQATLTVLFGWMGNVSVPVALTVQWWLIGLSYVLSVICLYKILVHFKVSNLIAVIFACLITISSPQIYRVSGHFGLAYMCIVPMLFYWTIRYNEAAQKRYCAYIFSLGLIATFFHPYFSGLSLVWGLTYALGYVLFTRTPLKQRLRHSLPIVATVIMLLVTVAVVMHFTDPVKDRPVMPYGFFAYYTHFNDIFTSFSSPVWIYVRDHHMLRDIFPFISSGGEGYAYIGLPVTFALIFSLFTGIFYRIRKKKDKLIARNGVFSPIWLFMAFVALLFSMAIPFIWHMEWLLDYMSFMKQFRSLGRFSWIFYYITTVYGVVIISLFYKYLAARRMAAVGAIVVTLAAGVWGYEANPAIQDTRKIAADAPELYKMFFSVGTQNWESFLKEHNRSKNEFQGILMLPFFHVGSDKLWVGHIDYNMTFGAPAAFELHLPMVDALMARTSWSQSENLVKIAAGPYVAKPLLRDIKTNKPFLLLHYDQDSLDADQKYLLQASDYIGDYPHFHVYAFYPERQTNNDKAHADSINKILPLLPVGDTCIVNKGDWGIDHLDRSPAGPHFFGMGAVPYIPADDTFITTIAIKPQTDNQEYEFSAWFLLGANDWMSPCVFLEPLDSAGNMLGSAGMNTKWSVDNDSLWFRGSVYFRLPERSRAVRCRLSNMFKPGYKVMDELQLRPTGSLIISKGADGRVMVNNHLFKK